MGNKTKDAKNHDDNNTGIELKVSSDGGETWSRRPINMRVELDESGLQLGEIFQFQEKFYRVVTSDEGMKAKPIDKPPCHKMAVVRR
jgi:Neuraminidase (sialidase)